MIEALGVETARREQAALVTLLTDSVDSGASVGFLPPLDQSEAIAYWESVVVAIDKGSRLEHERGALAPSRLGFRRLHQGASDPSPPGGGVDHELHDLRPMAAVRPRFQIELHGADDGAVGVAGDPDDTRQGDPSELLYRSLGWELAGVIPRYARSAGGALDPSAFYYRLLESAAPSRR